MPQINHVRESGLGLDGVDTVFIDTSSLSELPSHLMHPQDLETFVGLNIHSSDLEALQVSSDSHDAGMLISDGVSVENDETDMDTSDPLPQNNQVMEVDSLQDNEVINELDLLHDGQEFLPITGTEEMMEQSQDDSHQKSLLCSSNSSLNQEDSGVASEESNQHISGVESLGPQILKTSSGQFVILQPNQNSISLGALGGKILSGGQIFTSLSAINSSNSKPIFVNASQLSGMKQITNLNQNQSQFRSVQLKQPLLLSQSQNSGPVTKVILPSQPGVSLSQQLRLMTSQANTNNQSGSLSSSPSKVTLQFQPISLLSSKNMQSPTKPYINDVKPGTKLKIPLNFPFKTGTTIPISQFTSLQNNELNEVLNISDNLLSTKNTTSNSQQKIIIKGKLPLNKAHSLPTTLKPGQILASSPGTQQLIKIPVSQLSQLTSQGQTIQVGNKMNFRLVTTNSNSMTTTNNYISSNQTLFKSININKPIAPNNNVVKPKVLPVSNQTLTINSQGKRLLIPISNHNVISQSSSNTPGALHIRPQGSITLPASALPPGVLSNAQPGSLVMIPAQYFQNNSNLNNQIIQVSNQISQVTTIPSLPNKNATQKTLIDANGIKPRKPCNCTKSQCLKLYCDCFANGEFCNNCNCGNCYNNLTHEEDRQKAIKSCLERNPQAFRPKIGKGGNDSERRHNKGCNCKRSGCLKNYCECFEAKIPCSNMCKCCGCRNIDSGQPYERKKLIQLAEIAESRGSKPVAMKSRPISLSSLPSPVKMSFSSNSKSLFCRINQEVVEATCQCLLAQAEKSEKTFSDEETELRVINEFSRCLLQIIGVNSKSRGSVD